MPAQADTPSPPDASAPPARERWGSYAYTGLAWLFLTAVVLQVFFAGAGVLADGAYLARHVSFVEVFQPIPVFLVAAAFLARTGWFEKLAPAGIWLMLVLQYEFVKMSPSALAGLHTVNALGIFLLTYVLVRRSTSRLRSGNTLARSAGEDRGSSL